MKRLTKILSVMLMIAAFGAMALPAAAQSDGSKSKSITEDAINDSYRVSNPWRRSVDDLSVDLQPDQVVISATMTFRNGATHVTETTLIPAVTNGRVTWTVDEALIDGDPASDDLLAQINASITSSWANYVKTHGPTGRITAVDVTDDALTITYTPLVAPRIRRG
ncbi:hypothetical protein [Aggregatilinea lenta]|uniref:hypothetical protein n=1 Tax=Aggregatilinea lenta TaxID=913108 RepID=UPI000E5A323E|nr:hypothetical protein [Aggregatilinea lenta]